MIRNSEQATVCNEPGVELLNALREVALFRAAIIENGEDPHRNSSFGREILRLADTAHDFKTSEIAVSRLPNAPQDTIKKIRSLNPQTIGTTDAVKGYMSWELLATEGILGLYRPLAHFARPFISGGTADQRVSKRLRYDVSPIYFDPTTGDCKPSVALVVS